MFVNHLSRDYDDDTYSALCEAMIIMNEEVVLSPFYVFMVDNYSYAYLIVGFP